MKKIDSTAATHNIAAECYCVNNNNHLLWWYIRHSENFNLIILTYVYFRYWKHDANNIQWHIIILLLMILLTELNDQSWLSMHFLHQSSVWSSTSESLLQKHSHTSGESKPAVGSSIKPKTNQFSKKMTGRMSFCLWTDVLLVRKTSPRGWETDRSRPACDDGSKLRCIAFTGVMKSGHQRGKPRN